MALPESIYWLGFSQIPGIGCRTFLDVWAKLQTAKLAISDLWQLTPAEFSQTTGLSARNTEAFFNHKKGFQPEAEHHRILQKNIGLLTLADDHYPALLRQIPDPPIVLYTRGNVSQITDQNIAVVGTRKVTPYGRSVTQQLTKDLVTMGFTIVSGFMYGVDVVAHQIATDMNGLTIGVLGYGFDHLYPPTLRSQFDETLEKGGIFLSEYPPEFQPIPSNFPQRNRIVAGISRGVLVTEAAIKSGSKITANLAAEYGREVFAVPGPITSPYSEGTKDLINDGAKLVTNVNDMLAELGIQKKTGAGEQPILSNQYSDLNHMQQKIISTLSTQSFELDDLLIEIGTTTTQILSELTHLELLGLVTQEGGKFHLKL